MQLFAPFTARPLQDWPVINTRSVILHLPAFTCFHCGTQGRASQLLYNPSSPLWYCHQCGQTYWRWS
jgi:transcription elongation factor Elf1